MDMRDKNSDRYQQEAERFINVFSNLKEKKIVLYGIGRFSSTLIPRVSNLFDIVGLMDRDASNIGKFFLGIPVLSLEEAENSADCIIINTTSAYWQTIYKRIKESRIPVYFLNGQLAALVEEKSKKDNPYWEVDFSEYKKIADTAEIVSFDLFDTLLQRKCYLPSDVFALASEIVRTKLGNNIDYVYVRQQTRSNLSPNYTWEELRRELNKKYDQSLVNVMLDAELEAEVRLCAPRKFMCCYCQDLINKGTDVYVITDTYLPKAFVLKLLRRIGLEMIPEGKVIVSNEYNMSKKDGDLWKYFVQNIVKGKKAVHFGDNLIADVENAGNVGIIPCYIMNSMTMLTNSSVAAISPKVETLYESIVIGLLVTRLFDSPFSLSETKGRISMDTCKDIGYIVYAPLLVTFLLWLRDVTYEAGIKKLFFFARDGFFLERDYNKLCEIFRDSSAPKAHYLYISRQAAWIASISSEEDFDNILSLPYVGTFKNYMKSRWDVDVDKRTGGVNEQSIDEFVSIKELKNKMAPYLNEIKEKIRCDRKNYITYLDSLNIDMYCGFVDQGVYGTIQRYLSKILGYPLRSWNIVAQEDAFSDGNVQCSCYRGPDKTGYVSPLAENVTFIETLLTAPYGMIRRVDAKGNRVSDEPSAGQKYFADKEVMNQEIEQFIQDLSDIFVDRPKIKSEDREFMANLLMEIYQSGTVFGKEAVRSFIYENSTMHVGESMVFD